MRKILILLLCSPLIANAQVDHDTELWTGTAFQIKTSKKLKWTIAPEVRLNNNISTVKSVFSDIGLRIKLSKMWSLKNGFRYTFKPLSGDHRFRTNLDFLVSLKKKKKKLSFRNRLRGQVSYGIQSGNFDPYLREQILFGYNLSKLVDPYCSAEIFFKFRSMEFRQFRLCLGADWKIQKWWSVSTFYIYQREIFNANPDGQHVFGLNNTFSFKKKKKKSSSSL